MPDLTGIPGIIVGGSPGAGTNPTTLAAADITSVIDTVAANAMLTFARDPNGGEYLYMTGVASTVAGSAVTYDENGITTLVVANASGPVAFAMAATVASTFGWYCVKSPRGGMLVNTDSTIADNGHVYIDGTAGRVDDTAVTGDRLLNAIFRGTDSSNFTLCEFNWPSVTDAFGA